MRFYTVQSAAELLGVKQKGFFHMLRAQGFLSKHNLPREIFIQRGLFEIAHRKWINPATGNERISSRTLLTQKGVAYFDELLRKQAPQTIRIRDRRAANESGTARSAEQSATALPGTGETTRDEHFRTQEPNKMQLIESVIHNWRNIRRNAVIIDVETTGLGPDAEIIEISVIDAKGRALMDTLVQPFSHTIPTAATAIHGIDDAEVRGAPFFSDIYIELRNLLHQRHVIAYNAAFEQRIIDQTCALYKLQSTSTWQSSFLCAMESYADFRAVPCDRNGYKWHKLSDAADYEHITATGPLHRAQADAQLTLKLIDNCYQQLQQGATA